MSSIPRFMAALIIERVVTTCLPSDRREMTELKMDKILSSMRGIHSPESNKYTVYKNSIFISNMRAVKATARADFHPHDLAINLFFATPQKKARECGHFLTMFQRWCGVERG